MLTLYVYNPETNVVIAEFQGETNTECEARATASDYASAEYGWTYSPAFGMVDGLKR